jgi:hypothetical protein
MQQGTGGTAPPAQAHSHPERAMNMRRALRSAAMLLLPLLALVLVTGTALACKEDVDHAKARLNDLESRADHAKPKDLAQVAAKLKTAAQQIAKADKACKKAKNIFQKAAAVAQVASANASMDAAAEYIPNK